MPMLDEAEFAQVAALYRDAVSSIKAFRAEHGLPLEGISLDQHFQPLRALYTRLTGFDEPNHLAILHHRLSLYGPPCAACGRPLRTPAAKLCAACGSPRAVN